MSGPTTKPVPATPAVPAALPVAVTDAIDVYTPRLPDGRWTGELPGFVRKLVAASCPKTAHQATNLMTLASRLVTWAHYDKKLPLVVEDIVTDDVIDEWLALQGKTPGSTHVARSRLRSLDPAVAAAKLAPKAAVDPRDPAAIAAVIAKYRPSRVSGTVWKTVRPIAVAAVEADAPVSIATARRDLSVAARYLAWCSAQPGLPMNAVHVWSDASIARYLARVVEPNSDGDGAARTDRSILKRLGRAVPGSAVAREPRRYLPTNVKRPYGSTQVQRLRQAAGAEATSARRDAFAALLCLTVGAGLGEQDVAWPRGTDVTCCLDGSVTIEVCGPRPRTVVVDDAWAGLLVELAERIGDAPLIGGETSGRRNVASSLIDRLTLDPELTPLTVTRLRDTWVANRLAAGTALPVITEQAALSTLTALERLLPYLAAPDDVEARAQLRTARPAADLELPDAGDVAERGAA